jgi:multidrug transporter EmrE-like cation transporter
LQATAVPHTLNKQSVALVFCCTLLGAGAQVFMKMGAANLSEKAEPGITAATFVNAAKSLDFHFYFEQVMRIVTNVPLFAGYALYGISTMLLVMALRKAQLSILYPIISLTYVWVAILSVVIFHESMNGFKLAGLITVIAGVAVLGRDGR